MDVLCLVPCAMRALQYPESKRALLKAVVLLQKYSPATLLWPRGLTKMWGDKKELLSAGRGMSEFISLCSNTAQTFQHGDSVGQLAHHCSLPVAEFSWDAGSSCLFEQPFSYLCGCLLCFPQFGYTQNSMSKYALIAHITLKFSSETLLSSTGLDYDLKLAATYCWLSIL